MKPVGYDHGGHTLKDCWTLNLWISCSIEIPVIELVIHQTPSMYLMTLSLAQYMECYHSENMNAQITNKNSTLNMLGHSWVTHDDIIKWKHFLCHWPFVRGIHWSPVDSTHKGQWYRALMFPLIYTLINVWANNRDTGDLRWQIHSLWSHCNVLLRWLQMFCHEGTMRLTATTKLIWLYCQMNHIAQRIYYISYILSNF